MARVGTASTTGDGRARHTSTGWLTKGKCDEKYTPTTSRGSYRVDRMKWYTTNGTGGRIRRWERLMIDMRGAVGSLFDTCTKEGLSVQVRVQGTSLECFTKDSSPWTLTARLRETTRDETAGMILGIGPSRRREQLGAGAVQCRVQARVDIRSSQRPLFLTITVYPYCVCSSCQVQQGTLCSLSLPPSHSLSTLRYCVCCIC